MSFYVTITDATGKEIQVKVSFEIYQIFEDERKARERYRKEVKRHYSDKAFDETTTLPSVHRPSVLDSVISQSKLNTANKIIQSCTPTQQRRFRLNRILGYSFTEIAKIEGCSVRAVKFSVDAVIEKLEKLRKTF
ncbi:MAG: hypothetical protein SNH27_12445 [Rikenellaceae bacterium]